MEPIAEISNTALHKGISRITIKGIVTPDTKTAKDLLHIQEQTLSSPRISKNWDLLLGFWSWVCSYRFQLHKVTRETWLRTPERREGKVSMLGGSPGVVGVFLPGVAWLRDDSQEISRGLRGPQQ